MHQPESPSPVCPAIALVHCGRMKSGARIGPLGDPLAAVPYGCATGSSRRSEPIRRHGGQRRDQWLNHIRHAVQPYGRAVDAFRSRCHAHATPASPVLVSRRHVDPGRLASAACRRGPCCVRSSTARMSSSDGSTGPAGPERIAPAPWAGRPAGLSHRPTPGCGPRSRWRSCPRRRALPPRRARNGRPTRRPGPAAPPTSPPRPG